MYVHVLIFIRFFFFLSHKLIVKYRTMWDMELLYYKYHKIFFNNYKEQEKNKLQKINLVKQLSNVNKQYVPLVDKLFEILFHDHSQVDVEKRQVYLLLYYLSLQL